MAEVFLGSTMGAEGFSRRVAIKRVLPGYSDNEQFAQMFVAEVRISSQLVHPNIVSVLDFDRDAERRLFLVMELVDGKDLDGLSSTGLLPIPVVIFTISEVLRGLGYAHDLPVGTDVRGVVHRDVSPHNVLLSWEGAVKVSDFGIAKARAASEATASVFIKGKPAYMSPEQANGQALDGRSDLFAVGIMLWEMLVGRRLFEGSDTRAVLAAVLFGQIPRPRSIRADIPKDLERVVMKLLEKEAPARYATAEDAIRALLACADAPRNGRELLMQTLAERFPHQVPVRQSMMRNRPSANQLPGVPTPVPANPYAATTANYAQGAPAAAMPSLGSVRNAPTHTIELSERPKKSGRLVIAAVGVVLVSLATFGIIAATRSSDPTTAPVAQGPAVIDAAASPSDASVQVALPIDAAPSPVDAAPVPVDAPAPDAAIVVDAAPLAPDARPSSRVPSKTETAILKISADPALTVYIKGKRYGDTYQEIPLTVGATYTVVLKNEERDFTKQVKVTISKDRENRISVLNWDK